MNSNGLGFLLFQYSRLFFNMHENLKHFYFKVHDREISIKFENNFDLKVQKNYLQKDE